MLALGWLSGNAQARAVRDRWHSLPRQAKRGIEVEDLCRAVGIDVGQYFGIVAATAFDLGMDLAPFISGVERMTTRLAACVNQVMGRDSGQSKQYRESATVSPGFARLLSAEGCRDAMAGFREKWTLSQQQFSKVLGCGLRSVKRWEGRQCNPQPHQRWILELLRRYVSRKGVSASASRRAAATVWQGRTASETAW